MNFWPRFSRNRRNQELDEEIRAHLAMSSQDRMDRGETAAAARSAARREFGNPTLIQEVTREMWGWNSLETLLQDARFALRMMRRTPGFTAVAVLSLALGIGANTAIFSLIDTLMLRSLPVRSPEQLVELLTNTGDSHFNAFSWQTYDYMRGHNHVFSGLIASTYDPYHPFHVSGEGQEPERVDGGYVVGSFFPILGVKPALGRLIGPEDDSGSPAAVAVVSWPYWKNRFNLDPAILGKRIVVEDQPVIIVGVTGPEFFGLQVGSRQDIWLPLSMEPLIHHPSFSSSAGYKWLRLVGRLRPGVPIDQARAELGVLFQRTLEDEAALNSTHQAPHWKMEVEPAGAGLSRLRDDFAKPLLVLMGIVCLLLLIACANVASMLLARGAARQREMAVRVSLGAGRLRIVRQLLTESLLLSVVAGALGVLLAYAGSQTLVEIMATGSLPVELHVRPDARVLLFTVGVSLATGVFFGLLPAIRAMGAAPAPSLREAGRCAGETRFRRLFGKALVVSQVALSVILLTAAALFVRNLANLENLNLGFNREHVVLFPLDPSRSGYSAEQLSREYRELLGRFESIPGVRSVSICWMPPISGGGSNGSAVVEGYTPKPGESRTIFKNWVAPRYFETLGIPFLEGRDFNFQDQPQSTPVAIINQAMARAYFGAANPIGKHVTFDGDSITYEIVGVAGDTKYLEIREAIPKTIYLAAFQQRLPASQFLIRTAAGPLSVLPEVRRQVRDLLKTVPVGKVMTMAQQVDASIVQERLIAMLSGLFGALGSLLAAIGLYGLLAYTVARRTNEIGIRMALGARRGDVTRMVLGDALLMVAAGLMAGAPIALWGKSFVAGFMKDLPAKDAVTIVFAVLAMVAVGLLAAYVPARRASRVDPMEALRCE